MKTLIAKLKASLRRETKRRRPDKLSWGYAEWMAEHRRLLDEREELREKANRIAIQAERAASTAASILARDAKTGRLYRQWNAENYGRYEV